MLRIYELFDYMRRRGFTIEDNMKNVKYLDHFYYHEQPKPEYKHIENYSVEHYYYTKGNVKISIFRSVDLSSLGHDYWELGNLSDLSDVDRFWDIYELKKIVKNKK